MSKEQITNEEKPKTHRIGDYGLDDANFTLNNDGTMTVILKPEELEELQQDIAENEQRETKKDAIIEKSEKYKEMIIKLFNETPDEIITAEDVLKKLNISDINYQEIKTFLNNLVEKDIISAHYDDPTDDGLYKKK